MRLGQLSRRINVRSAEIVKFLSSRGISVDDSVNARIEDEHIGAVLEHFEIDIKADELLSTQGARRNETAAAQSEEEDVTAMPAPVEETALSRPSIDADESVQVQTPESQSLSVEESTINETQPDVIKAPKVELQGLKILGKIELPDSRKKQPEVAPDSLVEFEAPSTENTKPVREHRKTYESTRQKETRQRKNPIALQREREEKAEQERKEEKAKLEKEKRTLYYQKRVQPTAPVRAARMIDEPVIQLHEEEEDKPKSLWGRFIKWLTT